MGPHVLSNKAIHGNDGVIWYWYCRVTRCKQCNCHISNMPEVLNRFWLLVSIEYWWTAQLSVHALNIVHGLTCIEILSRLWLLKWRYMNYTL